MNWALKRQIFYISVVLLFFLIFGFLISYPYLNKQPTCFDHRKNGDEIGVDCGGACSKACLVEQEELSVLWSRAFRVVPGRYNAVAYIENKNDYTKIDRINYRFRFADKDNIYIGMREGFTYVPPASKFAVFEPAIDVGNSIPIYTTFEFTDEVPLWRQADKNKVDQLQVYATNIVLENEITSPRLTANVKNTSLFTIPNVNVIAILYDASNNAVSISKTYLDELGPQESQPVSFTWPESIPNPVVFKEIIPMYNIDSVKLK